MNLVLCIVDLFKMIFSVPSIKEWTLLDIINQEHLNQIDYIIKFNTYNTFQTIFKCVI